MILSKEQILKEIKNSNGSLWIKFFSSKSRFVLFAEDAIRVIEENLMEKENIEYIHIVYRVG